MAESDTMNELIRRGRAGSNRPTKAAIPAQRGGWPGDFFGFFGTAWGQQDVSTSDQELPNSRARKGQRQTKPDA